LGADHAGLANVLDVNVEDRWHCGALETSSRELAIEEVKRRCSVRRPCRRPGPGANALRGMRVPDAGCGLGIVAHSPTWQ
jgi:2-polyprenyl-3-methyl-5-hydroxy-6-metoxy-1,4-benzoquinol methylase